jgi:hypothetical protein
VAAATVARLELLISTRSNLGGSAARPPIPHIPNELDPRDSSAAEPESGAKRIEVGKIIAKIEECRMPTSRPAPSHELFQRLVAVYVTQCVAATYSEARHVLGSFVIVELYGQTFTN